MYLKIFGLLVIFICSIYAGRILASRYSKRHSQLTEFITFMEFFETEITYTSTPVIEIFHQLILKVKPPFHMILQGVLEQLTRYGYRPLCDIWKENLEEYKDDLSLDKEDLEIFIYFGNILGTTDKENQKKYFEVIKSRLSVQLVQAYENKIKYSKLFNELGVIVGLLIIILLI